MPEPDEAMSLDPYVHERLKVMSGERTQERRVATRLPRGMPPQTWRQLLHYAVSHIYPNGELSDREYLAQFEERQGSCSTSTLVSIAQANSAARTDTVSRSDMAAFMPDIIFVLLMLGVWPEHPQADVARKVLQEYLMSPSLIERMVSAISLSHLRDEKTIPVLLSLLTEGIPDSQMQDDVKKGSDSWQSQHFEHADVLSQMLFRRDVVAILARWGVRSAIPVLRRALLLAVGIERIVSRRDPLQWSRLRSGWVGYQFELVGALGRLGAFGALSGIELPDDGLPSNGGSVAFPGADTRARYPHSDRQLDSWRVTMCTEAASQYFEQTGRHGVIQATEVRSEIDRMLAEQFGLDEGERRRALEPYFDFQLELLLN